MTELLPDELNKLEYPKGLDEMSVLANYGNRRQLERHQELLGASANAELFAKASQLK